MDYWPNVDAVRWFASDILPRVRARHPEVDFAIVGMRPTPEVLKLAREGILVTGTVPDVRPFLRHAGAVVAPLRVARGVQNKILEAMAMGCAVVASAACASGIEADAGRDFIVAADANEFVERIVELIESPARRADIGTRARQRICDVYSWPARLSRIDDLLAESGTEQREAVACAS
jgi:glycosyltransferase involved in cell wall biosynthesis